MMNPKMQAISNLELPILSAAPQGEKTCVLTKKLPCDQNCPNFLKFGLEVLYEVLCCAKEASAKI